MLILDIIHKETRSVPGNDFNYAPIRSLTDKLSNENWKNHIKRFGYSFIDDLFSGQHINIITCKTCGKDNQTFEVFNSLSLNIDQNNNSLNNSFAEYFKVEPIHDYECSNCRKKTMANKLSTIWILPKILIICLNRFSSDATSGATSGSSGKNHTMYELMNDISFYNTNLGRVSYRLKVIVNHIGSNINSGHYTSVIIEEGGKYWNIDDDNVTQIHPFNKSSVVYMLIYERV
jgi:ubiquitin C-terminal hydrolase